MPWEELDVNNPEVYAPRSYPSVQKAPRLKGTLIAGGREAAQEESSKPSADFDFVFDDDPRWNRPVGDIEILRGAQEAGKKRQPPAAKGQGKAPEKRPPKPAPQNAKPHGKESGEKRHRKEHPFLYVGIITGCLLVLSVIAVMMMPQVAGYFWKDLDNYAFINGELLRYDPQAAATYRQYREYMRQDLIYPGIFVDGTHIGGMTVGQAREALADTAVQAEDMFSVTVAIGNKTWLFNGENVPATKDLGNVLDRAYAIGRVNTTEILGTKQTPFRERVSTAMALREKGVNLKTRAAYDHTAVRSMVEEIARTVTRPPMDAQIGSFDFNTRSFVFVDEQVGVTLDTDALYDKVIASLDKWEKGTTLTMDPVLTQPTVTKAKLQNSFKMVAAYTTDTTNDSNRNNNIDLACKAINGTALMPGETFSFNKATGQRTIEKGYKEAGAISAGQSIEEVGGGICQVSSTLFNAVARADLEITSRSPHAWPSTYVNRGEDATVNWPNLDFQFKNNRSTPVFVIAYYKNRKVSAEIWGLSLGDGVTIDLKSDIVKTMEPSTEVKYVNNPSLAYGTSKETVKARTGYVVDTYKVWYQNGKEVKREKLHTSTYKAYQRTVEYN